MGPDRIRVEFAAVSSLVVSYPIGCSPHRRGFFIRGSVFSAWQHNLTTVETGCIPNCSAIDGRIPLKNHAMQPNIP